MRLLLIGVLTSLVSAGSAGAGERFACNLNALTKVERAAYAKLARGLMAAVEERQELEHGYAFRLPAGMLMAAAEWVSYEKRCCPFFTFELTVARDDGPVWLSVTGSEGVKPFIREEFGLK